MTSKRKRHDTFGDRMLKYEDEARLFSFRRQTLSNIQKGYVSKKLTETHLFWPSIIILVIGSLLNNIIVVIIGAVLFFASNIISLIKARTDDLSAEEKYVRAGFDKEYGEGKYDETMENIRKRENERWKK
ncbi:MAG: hypothetical protein ACP5NW_04875 [Candidatus Woesearchaeota archaeon]